MNLAQESTNGSLIQVKHYSTIYYAFLTNIVSSAFVKLEQLQLPTSNRYALISLDISQNTCTPILMEFCYLTEISLPLKKDFNIFSTPHLGNIFLLSIIEQIEKQMLTLYPLKAACSMMVASSSVRVAERGNDGRGLLKKIIVHYNYIFNGKHRVIIMCNLPVH